MPLDAAATSAGEEPEPFVEQPRDLARAHARDPRRGELDRQRDRVEPSTDLHDLVGVRRVELQTRPGRFGAVHEQLHRFTRRDRLQARLRRDAQRRHPQQPLAGHAERLPARRQHPHPRRGTQDRLGQRGRLVEQMLTVVQHDQRLFAREVVAHALGQRPPRAWLHRQRGDDHLREQVGVVGRGELTQPHTIGEPGQHFRSDLEREARLAHTADPGQRHEPRLGECLRHPRDVVVAAHERRQLHRQVPRERVERPHTREVARQLRMHDLEHHLGATQVAQTLLAEIDQRAPLGQRVAREVRGRTRTQHLTAVTRAHDPRRPIQRRAVVVPVPLLALTGVHTHPHPQRPGLLPRLRAQRALRLDRRAQRVPHAREHRVHTITGRLDHVTVVRLDRRAQQLVVTRQRAGIASGYSSHRRVEPSRSVNKNVTVPEGNPVIQSLPRCSQSKSGKGGRRHVRVE